MDGWRRHGGIVVAGGALGILGSLLAYLGNPSNTGICVSCFLENTVGALGLHGNPRMQYLRPELLGFFLGSFLAAAAFREFQPRWRNPGFPLLGFGFLLAVGCAVFIGCPIKALLRLAAGDLTAVAGALGLGVGVWIGIRFLGRVGSALEAEEGRARPAPWAFSVCAVALVGALAVLVFVPGAVPESRAGGGSLHAPAAMSLSAGFVLGALCQRSRFCITGSVRDLLLTRSLWPAAALAAALTGAAALDAFTGQFRLGYYDQPGSHLEWVWSALGMTLVGLVSVLAGGCPFRQIIKAGEGDLDAASVVAGMLLGAAVVQNWGLGATAAGVPPAGRVAVLLGLAGMFGLGLAKGEEHG